MKNWLKRQQARLTFQYHKPWLASLFGLLDVWLSAAGSLFILRHLGISWQTGLILAAVGAFLLARLKGVYQREYLKAQTKVLPLGFSLRILGSRRL